MRQAIRFQWKVGFEEAQHLDVTAEGSTNRGSGDIEVEVDRKHTDEGMCESQDGPNVSKVPHPGREWKS